MLEIRRETFSLIAMSFAFYFDFKVKLCTFNRCGNNLPRWHFDISKQENKVLGEGMHITIWCLQGLKVFLKLVIFFLLNPFINGRALNSQVPVFHLFALAAKLLTGIFILIINAC